MEPEKLYTVEELSAILRVGRTKAWDLVRRGLIRSIRLGEAPGSKRLIRESEIEAFLERSTV